LPEAQLEVAVIPGMPDARHWGDVPMSGMDEFLARSTAEMETQFPAIYEKPHHYLAISGGGANGAFGAGLLAGWSEAGTRPEFTMVTGISTGALMAPFAFLGPKYDGHLKAIYTEYSTEDLLEKRNRLFALFKDAMTDSAPLRGLIAEYLTAEVLAEIAEEHRRGRRLFIGTTNLDIGRPVVWDIGEIAASEKPGALELVHSVMLASASIPAMMPPVLIEVESDGKRYDEMHVDGGTASQVFLYPVGTDWTKILDKLRVPGRPNVYVLRNAYLSPEWEATKPGVPPIALRSISSLIRTQGFGDLYRIYLQSLEDDMDFNFVHIPPDFHEKPSEEFDKAYMRKLFERGRVVAKENDPWRHTPPGFEP
jgi:predicted acylesterase/phospholipase RssA